MKHMTRTIAGIGISGFLLTTAFADSQQIAARGRTEAEGCTKAHNDVVRWSQQYGWQLRANGKQMSEGTCQCRGDANSGYYCEIAISY